jgi:hypothetical protein
MTLFLLLVIAAIVLGLIGAVTEGLFYLLVIGIVVFLAALIYLGMHLWRSGRHHGVLRCEPLLEAGGQCRAGAEAGSDSSALARSVGHYAEYGADLPRRGLLPATERRPQSG